MGIVTYKLTNDQKTIFTII